MVESCIDACARGTVDELKAQIESGLVKPSDAKRMRTQIKGQTLSEGFGYPNPIDPLNSLDSCIPMLLKDPPS